MAKAVGIGGIFLKYNDHVAMRNWFETALGLKPNDYGVLFSFNGNNLPKASLQLGTFPSTSKYFGKDEQQVMINFRVDDLVELEKHLRSIGTPILNTIEEYDFGKFLHIEDPEGNKVELWQAVDGKFDEKTHNEMS